MSVRTTDSDAATTEHLAGFLEKSLWEDLPHEVRHEAKRSLLNFFGTAIGGCRDAAVESALAVLGRFAGPPAATLIGRNERTDLLNAAFINAASANVFDFDDTHIPTIIHPTAPVAPALLSLAESRRLSGRELLHAFILGVETECRIGNAVSPCHYRRGWHITATCGVFGAAAAVGKALGLDWRRLSWAIGNASAQSSGLVETLGSMAKSLGVGNSSRNGLLAALLAECDFAGPDRPLEGPRGFVNVMGDNPDLAAITDGLGDRWEILRNTYKPYPCGVVLNPVIEGCLMLRTQHDIAPDSIAGITVTGCPLLRERANRASVASGHEAQVSAQHSVAATLLYGAAGVAQFDDAVVREPAVARLREKVRVEDDSRIPVEGARISVYMLDGAVLKAEVKHAIGSLQRPMTDGELEVKFRSLAEHGWPGCEPAPLIDAIWSIESIDDMRKLLHLARRT